MRTLALKIAVTHCETPVGQAIAHSLECQMFNSVFFDHNQVDWLDATSIQEWTSTHRPDVVIHAGLPNMSADAAVFERFSKASTLLADTCRSLDIIVLHLSSFEVYDASIRRPDESDTHFSNTPKAQALLQSDRSMLALNQSIVLRLSWMINFIGDNVFADLTSAILNSDKPIACNNHFKGLPTLVEDISRVIVAILKQIDCGAENWGVIHYASEGAATELGIANMIHEALLSKNIERPLPIALDNKHTAYCVPARSALLDSSRCMANFGIQPGSWIKCVPDLVDTYSNLSTPEPISS